MGEEGNEALNFVVEPPLISEEEIDDDHRCADQVVIEILSEKPSLLRVLMSKFMRAPFGMCREWIRVRRFQAQRLVSAPV